MKKHFLLLIASLICIVSGMTLAQEKMSPLVNLLSYVPDSATALSGDIQYLNITALIPPYEAYTGTTVTSQEDVLNMIINRANVGVEVFQYSMRDPEGIEQTTGVNPLEIQTLLAYGMPPARGLVMTGGYSAEAVNEAHRNREYVEEIIEDFTLWCGDAECDGLYQNLREVERTNLFDIPPLGRKPPVAVSETAIVSATDIVLVRDGITGQTAGSDTLAQMPDFGVLANALTQDAPGELIQAYIMPPAMVLENFPVITSDMSAEDIGRTIIGRDAAAGIDGFVEEIAGYGTLPPYTMLAFADYFDGTHDVTVIALVYLDAEQAQTAADEVAKRLSTFHDVVMRRGAVDESLPEQLGVTGIETSVFTQEGSGIAVARIAMTYPHPDPDDTPRPATGLLFRRLLGGVFQRSFYPLWQIELAE